MSERVSSADTDGARATTGIEADCQTEGAFLEPQGFRVVLTAAQEGAPICGFSPDKDTASIFNPCLMFSRDIRAMASRQCRSRSDCPSKKLHSAHYALASW